MPTVVSLSSLWVSVLSADRSAYFVPPVLNTGPPMNRWTSRVASLGQRTTLIRTSAPAGTARVVAKNAGGGTFSPGLRGKKGFSSHRAVVSAAPPAEKTSRPIESTAIAARIGPSFRGRAPSFPLLPAPPDASIQDQPVPLDQ